MVLSPLFLSLAFRHPSSEYVYKKLTQPLFLILNRSSLFALGTAVLLGRQNYQQKHIILKANNIFRYIRVSTFSIYIIFLSVYLKRYRLNPIHSITASATVGISTLIHVFRLRVTPDKFLFNDTWNVF